MRLALAIILMTLTGCATTEAINPAREMYDHGWNSIHRAKRNANDRATAEAQAGILRAFIKLKLDLKENSSNASRRREDMAATFHGRQIPELSPNELGDVVGRLIDAAALADSHRLVDFRKRIDSRDNPDGFDPVRRAILDQELKRRGVR